MRILIDVGHPGHVHYFKNAIQILQQKGHTIKVTARDKEVTFSLLDAYHIPYVSRGKGGRGLTGKLLYLLKGNWLIWQVARQFKPDLFLSFASSYAAQVSFLCRKPHIAFDDTEHALFEHIMYVPFTDAIATPTPFRKDLGSKQVRFDGYIELCHLAPGYFTPDASVLNEVGISADEKFVVIRFVSWEASHDVGMHGLNNQDKISLVNKLTSVARVFISSEGGLPTELDEYRLKLAPHRLHDLLAFSSLYIGEGLTTATECALLGVPSIVVSDFVKPEKIPGVQIELREAGVQVLFETLEGVSDKALELLQDGQRQQWETKRNQLLSKKIDVTAYMVWLIENYPQSLKTLQQDSTYQNRFLLRPSALAG